MKRSCKVLISSCCVCSEEQKIEIRCTQARTNEDHNNAFPILKFAITDVGQSGPNKTQRFGWQILLWLSSVIKEMHCDSL